MTKLSNLTHEFPGARRYLNTASVGLPPATAADELRAAIDAWQEGKVTAPSYDAYVDEARNLFAELVNVSQDNVAIGSQVSALVGMVAAGLSPRSRVLCPQEEFTSVIFPFLSRDDLNVTFVPLDELATSITSETDLVAFSLVQSADGRVVDGKTVADIARGCGAVTLVDTTQAAGWLPFDAGLYDFTVTGTYKWLMSPRGSAFMTVRKEVFDLPDLLYPGWYAGEEIWESIYGPPLRLAEQARRFDLSPAWLAWVGTAAALRFIREVGVGKIHEHNVTLANLFRDRLKLAASDSAIVSLELPETTHTEKLQQLSTASRAGRLRVGFHLYNQIEDVELLVEALVA
ncbi:MAG: aminotransferase [Gammaproteobacteria bacterium]|nr:aminotransferase [Gammaproteobacteria bacterium]HCL73830.1 aminotransferase [Gammaproteobacteria bacterium]